MGLANIRIVLVAPIYGGNVGSVCRAMANMGLSDLALVAPPDLDLAEAQMMACHAQHILEGRHEYADLGAALADCGTVFGTSARRGLYRQHARQPRGWAKDVLAAADAGKTALVFGREDNGLSNEELVAGCDLGRREFYLRPAYIGRKLKEGITRPEEIPRLAKASGTFFKYLARGTKKKKETG